MTLKIKIPPIRQMQPPSSPQPQPGIQEHMEDAPTTKPQRTRKRPKRFQEDEENLETNEPERKTARNATSGKARRLSTSEPLSDAEMTPAFADPDVDVLDAVNDRAESDDHSEPAPPPRTKNSSKGQTKSIKGKGKAPTGVKKKKRNVVVSEDEDEEDNYMDIALDVMVDEDEDEDYYSPDEKPTKQSKGEAKSSSKGNISGQGTKRKAKAEPSDVAYASTEKKAGSSVAASRKKAKLPLNNEEVIDVVGDFAREGSVNVDRSSPATAPQDSPVIIPKRPKLPTIKKNKLAPSSGVSTPLSANPSSTKPPLELGLTKPTKHDEIRKTMINQTDIDLSNKSIYQEIFLKMTGDGGTPRRTKEEERRKELNRLRDEAKAKRLEEARHSFDLQAQYDKISRFEDKLRADRSSALWPNFLGAKWREDYEREKKRQKDQQQQWQEASYENREEGEVN